MYKWSSIQALRGVAVLGVVIFHCLSIQKKYLSGYPVLPDALRIGQSGVDLFFVISGFIMVMVTQGRFGKSQELLRFIWGRVTRIYPTYWVYFFLTYAVFVAKPNLVNASTGHQAHLLTSFFLLPDDQLPLVMVGWSLIHELWFYLVFTVLLLANEWLLLPALLIWALIITAVNLVIGIDSFPASARVMLHPFTLEFIVGSLVAIGLLGKRHGKVSAGLALSAVAFVLFAGLPLVYRSNLLESASLLRTSVMGLLYGLLVASLALLEMRNKLALTGFLEFAGDISYTVYLSHILVLSALGRLWLAFKPATDSILLNALVLIAMMLSVVAFGWLGYRFIELPLVRQSHRFRARWIGPGISRSPA